MSIKREIADLRETIRTLQRLVIRGALPDLPVLRQTVDGDDDIERFKRDYECTPVEALERGANAIVVLTNFRAPNVPVMPRASYERVGDPNYVSPLTQAMAPAPAAVEDQEVEVAPSPPEPVSDPLTAALLRQARDNARMQEQRNAGNTGK